MSAPTSPAHDRLRTSHLYLCTADRPDLLEFAAAAIEGGVDIIQLRAKGTLEARAEIDRVSALRDVAHARGALVAVNDRADIAIASGADVLHLGQGDLPIAAARAFVGPDVVIGLSTHHRDHVAAAVTDPDVDYFCTGPVWATPTKPGRAAVGLDLVSEGALAAGGKPWFAIGGIDAPRVRQVRDAGAQRIVVVRAITESDDPQRAAAELRAAIIS